MMFKVDTGDKILDEELDDFIDVILSQDRELLKTTLSFYRRNSSPAIINWIMDPVHFNVIQGLLIKNYNLKYISPRKTSMGTIDSHCGTHLPPTHCEIYHNWISNILKNL